MQIWQKNPTKAANLVVMFGKVRHERVEGVGGLVLWLLVGAVELLLEVRDVRGSGREELLDLSHLQYCVNAGT